MAEGDPSSQLSPRVGSLRSSQVSPQPEGCATFLSDQRLSQLFDPLSHLTESYLTSTPAIRGYRHQVSLGQSLDRAPRLSQTSRNSSLPSTLSDLAGDLYDVEMELPQVLTAAAWGSEEINWQERCLELELSMQKFRDQAGNIRELLRDKLEELEQRVLEAEARADEAEGKVRVMEERLESDWTLGSHPGPGPGVVTGDRTGGPEYGTSPMEREKTLTKLENQVEEQRQLRLKDAREVEAKAAKIKEWVTNKLRELEEQNQHLRQQNKKCTEQLELLRNQMSRSNISDKSCTENTRGSLIGGRSASDESLPPEIPARPSSSTLTLLRRQRSDSAALDLHQGHVVADPVYAEVDYTKKKSKSKMEPPRVRIERRKFSECSHISLLGLNDTSETKSRTSCDSWLEPESVEFEISPSLSPKSPLASLETCLLESDPPGSRSPKSADCIDSPRRRPLPLPQTQVPRKESDKICASSPSGYNVGQPVHSVDLEIETYDNVDPMESSHMSQSGYLAVSDDMRASVPSELVQLESPVTLGLRPQAVDEVHDYSEIYTPSKERIPWCFSQSQESASCEVPGEVKPPTPPLHRFPSWESRIYQVAANGFNLSDQVITGAQSDSTNNNRLHPNGCTASGGYCQISVPVYATVKGRASQIRSMPFTGDSSDSSDAEDHGDTRGTSSHSGDTSTSTSTDTNTHSTSHSTSSPSKSLKTPSSLSPIKHGSPSPSKSLKRDTSFESDVSNDYAIPPDALSSETVSLDSSMPSLLRTSYVESSRRETLEKAGYLTKLGGKLKTWRKRWFVLKNGILSYWKSQNDVNHKPQGQIILDDGCRVTRNEGAATFEVSTGKKKTYYLTADSIPTMEEWVRVLQNVLRRNATELLLNKGDIRPTIQGWLTKVKHGHTKRCWCVLIGKMFLYFKTPNDRTPLGQISMRDARVEEVDHISDSESEEQEREASSAELTIGIFLSHEGPTYLLMPNKQEKDSWLYHLTIVSGGEPVAGTQYEQLVQKLMEMDGDPNCVLWRHPHLLHSKENISQPLTTLSSESLQTEAVRLFKSCQLFMSVLLDSAGIDYHVVLAQNALQQCLSIPELQPELIATLVKQTSRHTQQKLGVQVNRTVSKFKHSRHLLLCATQSLFMCDSSSVQKSSPTSQAPLLPPDSKTNPPNFVFIQSWQLLALATSLFVPRNNKLLWYLKLHLQRNADSKTEAGKYAAYCQRALQRTLENSGREAKPSRMEVLSILLKNPYHHSLPHAIPVHFLNGTYQVVGFDGSTTVEEFLAPLNQEIGCRDSHQSGFALFSDDPIEKGLEHYLDFNSKLCDVLSKWETALREKGSGKFENTRVIRMTYKNRLYWHHGAKSETERERLLLCYQVNQQTVNGSFPLTRELALELAALMSQIEYGDYNSDKGRVSGGGPGNQQHHLQQAITKYFPIRYRENLTQEEKLQLTESLTEKWMSLKGRSAVECVRIYLTCTRKWPFFGASLFQTKVKSGDMSTVWLAVSDDGVSLLDLASMQPLLKYPYTSLVTFGGCQDDLMLVVTGSEAEGIRLDTMDTQKLLFSLPKPKILEVTHLIADYINAMGHLIPGTPLMGTLTRQGSHRSRVSRGTRGTPRLAAEPDILKTIPDVDSKLHHVDSKKRSHLDTGVE